jgi:hypothetical protein
MAEILRYVQNNIIRGDCFVGKNTLLAMTELTSGLSPLGKNDEAQNQSRVSSDTVLSVA